MDMGENKYHSTNRNMFKIRLKSWRGSGVLRSVLFSLLHSAIERAKRNLFGKDCLVSLVFSFPHSCLVLIFLVF
jgi:hypothetical protein